VRSSNSAALPIVKAAGFTIEKSERYKKGIVERLTARKPA
jgi:hypothetical protein